MIVIDIRKDAIQFNGSGVKMPLFAPKKMFKLYNQDPTAIEEWKSKLKPDDEDPNFHDSWRGLPDNAVFVDSTRQKKHDERLLSMTASDDYDNVIAAFNSASSPFISKETTLKKLMKVFSPFQLAILYVVANSLRSTYEKKVKWDLTTLRNSTAFTDARFRRLARESRHGAQIHYGQAITDSHGCLLIKPSWAYKPLVNSVLVILGSKTTWQKATQWEICNWAAQCQLILNLAYFGEYGQAVKEA